MSDVTERIFAACCPDSTIKDLHAHAARICEVVVEARIVAYRPADLDEDLQQQLLEVEVEE